MVKDTVELVVYRHDGLGQVLVRDSARRKECAAWLPRSAERADKDEDGPHGQSNKLTKVFRQQTAHGTKWQSYGRAVSKISRLTYPQKEFAYSGQTLASTRINLGDFPLDFLYGAFGIPIDF